MTNHRISELVDKFAGKRILVVGDVMLDEFIWGEVRRISPEAPVPVVEMQRRTFVPGGAGNTARNIVSLGGRAYLGGVVGIDHHANLLLDSLSHGQVNVDGVLHDDNRTTTVKSRVIAHQQQLLRFDIEDRKPLLGKYENRMLSWIDSMMAKVDACVLSDYAKGVVTPNIAREYLRMARAASKPLVVDPKGGDYRKYAGATVLKPNISETERLLKVEIHDETSLTIAGNQLSEELDGTAILITRGPQGMSLFRKGLESLHIQSAARDVFDVTGAGDTVIGTMALALGAGATLPEAALLANQAAGIVVGKVGTATTTAEQLQSACRNGKSNAHQVHAGRP